MKKYLLLFLAVCCLAEQSLALTWSEVSRLGALKSNELKSAQQQAESSRFAYYKSITNYLPQVSARLSSGQSTAASGTTQSDSYGLSATQSIFSGFANYFGVQSAYVNYQSDLSNLKSVQANFYYDLWSAFVSLYVAQQNVLVQQKILTMRQDNARMIKLFYESGREDKGNYLLADAQVADAEYGVAAAKRDQELAKFRLSQYLDNAINSAEGELQVTVDQVADFQALAQQSPTYLLNKAQLDFADLNMKSTWSEFLPSVSVQGSYQKSGTDWASLTSNKSWSLNVSYPFFPGGSNITDALANQAKLAKAQQDFIQGQKDLLYSIEQAYKSLKDAVESAAVQNTYLQAGTERAKIAQVKYLNGLTTYDEWNRTQNDYVSYQRNALTSNKTALLAEANFYKTYGGYIK